MRRLFAADHTLWSDDPTEIADRLGWIPVVGGVWRDSSRRCGLAPIAWPRGWTTSS